MVGIGNLTLAGIRDEEEFESLGYFADSEIFKDASYIEEFFDENRHNPYWAKHEKMLLKRFKSIDVFIDKVLNGPYKMGNLKKDLQKIKIAFQTVLDD